MSSSTAERSAAFERLFQAAEKQSKGFVPFPEHLRSLENRSTFSSSLAQHQASTHQTEKQQNSNQTNNNNLRDESDGDSQTLQKTLQQQQQKSAYNFCASRVPNLSENLERTSTALEAAHTAEQDIHSMSSRVDKMIDVTKTVRDYSERMSTNASALIAKRARVEGVLTGVSDRLKKFQKIDALHDEAIACTKYVANTSRFVTMLDEIEDSAAFLAEVSHHFKQSAQVYNTRLSIAYQRSMSALRDHCCDTLRDVGRKVTGSKLMKEVLLTTYQAEKQRKENAGESTSKDKKTESKEAKTEEGNTTTKSTDEEKKEQADDKKDIEKEKEEVTTNAAATSSSSLPSRPDKLSDALSLVDEEFTNLLFSSSETAFRLVEARIGAKEAEQFINDVFSSYADARLLIVEPLLIEYASSSSASSNQQQQSNNNSNNNNKSFNVTNFVHNMIETCISEANLFHQKIWISDLSSSFLRGPLEALVSAGYEIFRSKLLALDAVGQLCSLSFTLNEVQKKLHASTKQQQQQSNRNHHNSQQQSSASSSSSVIVSSVSLRNELISNAVSRFIQDTDERLMFRVSIYLRNGLSAPANVPVQVSKDLKVQVPISEWIFDRAVEALTKKVFGIVDDDKEKESNSSKVPFGTPQSLDIPTPFSAPFCLGSVVRLRWLCAQLKRSASGASAFAVFLEEATNAVIREVNGLLSSTWVTRQASAQKTAEGVALAKNNNNTDEKISPEKMTVLLSAISSILPQALALRQLLVAREALLSIGARLSVSESSFAFTTMQISKTELEVPKIVEEPFRTISDEAIKKLGAALSKCEKSKKNDEDNDVEYYKQTFLPFISTLQILFDQSVATQQLIWRGAVPIAVGEKNEELMNIWNALL